MAESNAPVRVPDVGTVTCASNPFGGTHRVMADGSEDDPVWACVHCGVSWIELDAQVRRDATPKRRAQRAVAIARKETDGGDEAAQ